MGWDCWEVVVSHSESRADQQRSASNSGTSAPHYSDSMTTPVVLVTGASRGV
jgi:hypothetical protein